MFSLIIPLLFVDLSLFLGVSLAVLALLLPLGRAQLLAGLPFTLALSKPHFPAKIYDIRRTRNARYKHKRRKPKQKRTQIWGPIFAAHP